LAANGFHRLSHLVDAAIQRFNRFYGCFHHPGMANHIAVRVVTDDGVVFSAFDGGDQFLGQLGGAHFRLQIVGRHFRRVNQDPLFAFKRLFYAAIEEEGDVSVFFSFGDAQLGFIVLRHPLAEGIGQRGGRIGAGDFDVGGVFGEHHEIEINHFLTRKAVEVGVDEGAGDFTRAVGTEVHEDQRVAVFHRGIGLAGGADNGRFHEFVVFVTGVGGLQTCDGGIGLEFAFGQGQQIISLFHAIPAVVAVHGVIAADERRDATFAQRGKFGFECRQRFFRTARRRITAVEEGVQVDLLSAALCRQLHHRHDVIFVAVDAAWRHQAHDMYCFAGGNRFIDRGGQYRVGEEGAFFNFHIETGQVLIDDTTGAQVDVAYFGVPHLTVRQADFEAGCIDQGMWTFGPQRVHYRRFSAINGVILLVFAIAVAIQNHQYHRFFRNRHCDNLMLKDRNFA
jgi:hypothetical protein